MVKKNLKKVSSWDKVLFLNLVPRTSSKAKGKVLGTRSAQSIVGISDTYAHLLNTLQIGQINSWRCAVNVSFILEAVEGMEYPTLKNVKSGIGSGPYVHVARAFCLDNSLQKFGPPFRWS